jgi:transcriptional regulator with XRE-family HTH domain
MSERAAKHVRKFLGQRLRALRKQRRLSQERLGDRAGLSGKFIGEVERGEKSISIDSVYRVSVALQIPLREACPQLPSRGFCRPRPAKTASRLRRRSAVSSMPIAGFDAHHDSTFDTSSRKGGGERDGSIIAGT